MRNLAREKPEALVDIAGPAALPDLHPLRVLCRLGLTVALHEQQVALLSSRASLGVGDDPGEVFEHRALRLAEVAVRDAVGAPRNPGRELRRYVAVSIAVVQIG